MLEKGLKHLLQQIDDKVGVLQESLGTGVAQDYAGTKRCVERYRVC